MRGARSWGAGTRRWMLPRLGGAGALIVAFHAGAIPVGAAFREDFCLLDPAVTVEVGGKKVVIQVWLGVPLWARPQVSQPATNASVQATADRAPAADGTFGVTVTAQVVAKGGAAFPVNLSLAVPSQSLTGETVWGAAGQELLSSIRVRAR